MGRRGRLLEHSFPSKHGLPITFMFLLLHVKWSSFLSHSDVLSLFLRGTQSNASEYLETYALKLKLPVLRLQGVEVEVAKHVSCFREMQQEPLQTLSVGNGEEARRQQRKGKGNG